MEKEFYHEVVMLFNRFIDDLDAEMYMAMQKTGEVYLQAPDFIINILRDALLKTYNVNLAKNSSGHFIFRGLEVIPSYELTLTMFHKDYPLYRESWMIKKISFEPAIHLKQEWYSTTVIKIKEFYGLHGKNISDN